jgi:MinD-like ATPase involved in chromosome partitioning or flagellar assembly
VESILIVNKNNEIIKNIFKIKLRNYSLLALDSVKFINHYLEEYLPKFLILSAKFENYNDIIRDVRLNSEAEILITDSDKDKSVFYQDLYLGDVKNLKDLERILLIIDKLKCRTETDRQDELKFISQQVISFYSIQGGVGKTSILFNLAWYLKDIVKGKILIIDLNFCEGPSDLNVNLGLNITPNLSMFIEKVFKGADSFDKSLTSLGIGKIDILQPPLSIHQSDKFNIDMLESIIYHARNAYDIILADIPFRYDNISLEMLNLSTASILVLSTNIRLTRRIYDFQKFLPSCQKKGIIVNKISPGEEQHIERYNKMLGIPVYEKIFFIPACDRKMVEYKGSHFNILDLQPAMHGLEKFIFLNE